MTYKDYTGLDRTELLSKVRHMMSDKRFNHVLGVECAAI